MRGFTLIEMLLSVALIGIIAAIGTPIYQSFQVRNDLDIATQTIVQNISRAKILARSMDRNSAWGVKIQTGDVTLFQGSSYNNRDITLDESTAISTSITTSGTLEYVFAKFTGYPSSAATTTLTSQLNETRTITVNTRGSVGY